MLNWTKRNEARVPHSHEAHIAEAYEAQGEARDESEAGPFYEIVSIVGSPELTADGWFVGRILAGEAPDNGTWIRADDLDDAKQKAEGWEGEQPATA